MTIVRNKWFWIGLVMLWIVLIYPIILSVWVKL